ncbi:hypothetical protein ABN36_18180 [Salmonella enterica subsp. enterica]|nr:hypothetical protein [Salmonella enterica subsp. enterica]EGI6509407.1 hypothetical protein [Salmonella enterica subsp. enterica serovar Durham]EHW9667322.1 hypothetical protein [Salmonella enterica subsp. enterica serovar Agbeni]EIU1267252.1 hypothetical protein [Salmonella enterica subsp. enterica serovar Agbeni]
MRQVLVFSDRAQRNGEILETGDYGRFVELPEPRQPMTLISELSATPPKEPETFKVINLSIDVYRSGSGYSYYVATDRADLHRAEIEAAIQRTKPTPI